MIARFITNNEDDISVNGGKDVYFALDFNNAEINPCDFTLTTYTNDKLIKELVKPHVGFLLRSITLATKSKLKSEPNCMFYNQRPLDVISPEFVKEKLKNHQNSIVEYFNEKPFERNNSILLRHHENIISLIEYSLNNVRPGLVRNNFLKSILQEEYDLRNQIDFQFTPKNHGTLVVNEFSNDEVLRIAKYFDDQKNYDEPWVGPFVEHSKMNKIKDDLEKLLDILQGVIRYFDKKTKCEIYSYGIPY